MAHLDLEPADGDPEPVGQRRMWLAGEWVRGPVYEAGSLRPGATVPGPAAVTSPFTTLVLRRGDRCSMTTDGDFLVDVGTTAG